LTFRAIVVAGLVLCALGASTAHAQKYGFVEFPRDEHEHVDGWNFWWGAADVYTTSGNHYTVGIAFDSLNGVGLAGQEVFAHQGPYEGRVLTSPDGPEEWGHGDRGWYRYPTQFSKHLPGVSDLLRVWTSEPEAGGREIASWQRTTMASETYRLKYDYSAAGVHPTGEHVALGLDLVADMKSPPLLAGGTGQWWYGLPEAHDYPSRSYQYVQGARRLSGTLSLEQPDGSVLRETVDPAKSSMVMIREYDASPEDLPAGLALAEATQLHPRYAQYYEGGMPWELVFLDLKNGAQLMIALLAFHDTHKGTFTPVAGQEQPTYKTLATLRLPNGKSVALGDDQIRVEHLSYKTHVGRVPTFWVAVKGIWTMAWEYRVSYEGGRVRAGDGSMVDVPAFDLGVQPQFDRSWPPVDERGNGPTQRIPFDAAGSYAGCPVRGFGWSELIIQWRGREKQDPWWTGGSVPPVPKKCGAKPTAPGGGAEGELSPEREEFADPSLEPNPGCSAYAPTTPKCEYESPTPAGLSGFGAEPGGWTVTITPADGGPQRVIKSHGGHELYACNTVRKGDKVVAEAGEGSGVFIGNPGICY
jgi:hypothetical protein